MEENRYIVTWTQTTAELLFRNIISINQLSIHGPVADDWCQELAQQIAEHSSSGTGNLVAEVNNDSESKVAPAHVPILTKSRMINVKTTPQMTRFRFAKWKN